MLTNGTGGVLPLTSIPLTTWCNCSNYFLQGMLMGALYTIATLLVVNIVLTTIFTPRAGVLFRGFEKFAAWLKEKMNEGKKE